MGQYYVVCNIDRREYLDPHKFGCGLKLMEFSGQENGITQALAILCASGNGRGGGDLHTDDLSDDEKAFIGSWAGDRIVVAGDYGDPWLFVPDDLKGREWTWEETAREPLGDGWYRENPRGKKIVHREVFGKRTDRKTGEVTDHDENLYGAARAFFTDISDKIIAVVAKADAPYHPWAAMDLSDDGWRDVPTWGALPQKAPKQPAGGRKAWIAYRKHAKPYGDVLVQNLMNHVRRHPDQRDKLLAMLQEELAA